MRILSGLTLFFYTLVFFIVGGVLIIVAFNAVPQDIVVDAVTTIYASPNTRLAMGFVGALLIFISILVVQITVGKMHREKTIAFENPDGQVTISLTAIEDLDRKSVV